MFIKFKVVGILLSLVSVVSAQNAVTLGTFGFSRSDNPVGFSIAGMQFYNSVSNSPGTLYSTNLPLNSVIHVYDGTQYLSSTYKEVTIPRVGTVIKWTSDFELPQGRGYWVETPAAIANVLSGDVPMDDVITNSIATGLQICSFPYPVDRVVTNLGFVPSLGDVIHVYDGEEYLSSTYKEVTIPRVGTVIKWTDETIPISVGQGFWYESVTNTLWVASRPYPSTN